MILEYKKCLFTIPVDQMATNQMQYINLVHKLVSLITLSSPLLGLFDLAIFIYIFF